MKSKGLERLLRLLLVLLGIGIGLALAQLGLQWYRLANTASSVPAWLPPAIYTGIGVLGGLIFLLLQIAILALMIFCNPVPDAGRAGLQYREEAQPGVHRDADPPERRARKA